MPSVSRQSLDEPNLRQPLGELVTVDQVDVRGLQVKRAVFPPGWHWKTHVSEELCTTRHVGYVASGHLHVVTADGNETEIRAGDVVVIDPGHDAWTVGSRPCVYIEFGDCIDEVPAG
jgi:mannose-6-phosphate isomerase-like protein (cupin superfamily)